VEQATENKKKLDGSMTGKMGAADGYGLYKSTTNDAGYHEKAQAKEKYTGKGLKGKPTVLSPRKSGSRAAESLQRPQKNTEGTSSDPDERIPKKTDSHCVTLRGRAEGRET